jgi:hypothetical protein
MIRKRLYIHTHIHVYVLDSKKKFTKIHFCYEMDFYFLKGKNKQRDATFFRRLISA